MTRLNERVIQQDHEGLAYCWMVCGMCLHDDVALVTYTRLCRWGAGLESGSDLKMDETAFPSLIPEPQGIQALRQLCLSSFSLKKTARVRPAPMNSCLGRPLAVRDSTTRPPQSLQQQAPIQLRKPQTSSRSARKKPAKQSESQAGGISGRYIPGWVQPPTHSSPLPAASPSRLPASSPNQLAYEKVSRWAPEERSYSSRMGHPRH